MTGARAMLEALIASRAARLGDGNRRALFADFDRLLDDCANTEIEVDPDPYIEIHERRSPVALRRISMRNWKLFERAEVTLPGVDEDKPLVLLGGSNGYGKSSLLEAVVFGLFGRRATTELESFLHVAAGSPGRRSSYRKTLESAFTRTERARNEGFASVELSFDCDGGGLVLQRKWYFDEAGNLIERDEELIAWVGEEGDLLAVPEAIDPEGWIQSEIERRVLPASLAPFFLFDGEQIDRMADSKLGEQLRQGIERVLGLDTVRALVADLRDYARDRLRDQKGTNERDESLKAKVRDLRLSADRATEQLAAIERELEPARDERDRLIALLAAPSGDSHAELQTLLESERRERMEADRLNALIVDATATEIPLAMIGSGLLKRVAASLAEDASVHVGGPIGSQEDLLLFLKRLEALEHRSITQSQMDDLKRAWAGGTIAEGDHNIWHPYLDRSQHREVEAAASAVPEGRQHVLELLDQLAKKRDEVARLAEEIDERRQSDKKRTEARETLAKLSMRLEAMEERRLDALAELERRMEELAPEEARLEAARASNLEAAPRVRRAERARSLGDMADRLVEEGAPRHFDRFAEAVTDVYRSLSHKSDVAGIEITPDGNVRLVDGGGRDISDLRRSAGESQIFAMALIGAVGSIAGPGLPLIVDTPFGRLDTRHRSSVLGALAGRSGQTILLVQPEEFGPREIEEVGDRIAGTFEIEYRDGPEGGAGTSTLHAEELAA